MKEIAIEECKQIELEIFQVIIELCERHNLRYILDYGSLIGAVRHGGFIPWDDDIDVSMPRPDYERFKELWNEERREDTQYELRTGMKGNLAIPYIQVVHTGTLAEKKGRRKNYTQSVWVDVFPIDGAGETKEQCEEIYQQYWKKIEESRKIFGRYHPYLNPIKQVKQWYWHHIKKFQLPRIIREAEDMMQTYDYEKSTYVFCYPTIYGTKEHNEKSFYENRVDMTFEGISCKVPKEYDRKLAGIYGDYMTPPPKEKQKGHDYVAYWKEGR